jgi:hypothetical protein
MLDGDVVLYPYRTTPRRIADDVVAVLASVPEVVAISLFGSLAGEDWDGLSDVDMLAGYDGGEDAAWACAETLRAALPVRYYRTFTGVEQPSGRYWFWGESAFHKVDVSFYPLTEYERRRVEGVRTGYPIASIEVMRRDDEAHSPPARPDSRHPPARPEPVTVGSEHPRVEGRAAPGRLVFDDREQAAGAAVYGLLECTKQYLRGQIDRPAYDEAYRAFLGAAAGVGPYEEFAGGDLYGLVQECFALRFAIEREERGG